MKYQRFSPKFWQDPRVRRWSDQQKLLGAYLQTCPHRTTEGLFWLPHGYVAQDLGWGIDRVSEGYSGLIGAGFVAYDDTTETVLLLHVLKDDAPAGPKQIAGAISRLADVPASPLFAQLRDAAARYAPEFAAALDTAFEGGPLANHRYPIDTPSEGDENPIDSSSSNSSSYSSTKTPSSDGSAADPESSDPPVKARAPKAKRPEREWHPDAQRLCDLLADLIKARTGERPPIGKGWLEAAHLLLTHDGPDKGYSPEWAEELIRWSQADVFWQSNILSMPKLREKRLQLKAKLDQGKRRNGNGSTTGPGAPAAAFRTYDRTERVPL
jgi:hypothetical protein